MYLRLQDNIILMPVTAAAKETRATEAAAAVHVVKSGFWHSASSVGLWKCTATGWMKVKSTKSKFS